MPRKKAKFYHNRNFKRFHKQVEQMSLEQLNDIINLYPEVKQAAATMVLLIEKYGYKYINTDDWECDLGNILWPAIAGPEPDKE